MDHYILTSSSRSSNSRWCITATTRGEHWGDWPTNRSLSFSHEHRVEQKRDLDRFNSKKLLGVRSPLAWCHGVPWYVVMGEAECHWRSATMDLTHSSKIYRPSTATTCALKNWSNVIDVDGMDGSSPIPFPSLALLIFLLQLAGWLIFCLQSPSNRQVHGCQSQRH